MKVTTTKSKNSESFYITMSYVNNEGKSTSKTIRKLGTLKDLSRQLATDRDGVLAWAKGQARIETQKYKKQHQAKNCPDPLPPRTGSLIITSRNFSKEATSSLRRFITSLALNGSAEKSGTNTIPL